MTSRQVGKAIQNKGLRPTPQRIAVYDYLLQHPIHPTADTIYRALVEHYPTFSRTTIYNSLHGLLQAGLIRTVNIDADEQRFDGNPADHGHFRCTGCGEVLDFPVEEQTLDALCPAGFEVVTRDVFLSGVCPACQRRTTAF